jgi:hypothetical protein
MKTHSSVCKWCCQGKESNMEKPETATHTEVGTVQKLCVQVLGRLNGREGMQRAILSLFFHSHSIF